jgi:hypothetical protein
VVVVATLAFCLCSVVSGFATSFLMLLGARLLMGAAEGGVMPVSHAMIVSEVAPERRGLAMGVAQNLGSNLLGSGWRRSCWCPWRWRWLARRVLSGRRARRDHRRADLVHPARTACARARWRSPRVTLREAFAHRNVVLCA